MFEFRLLGSVDLKGSEGETLRSVLAQPKRVALLAYLAVAKPNGFHRRDKLLGLFWPESDQEHGRAALRKAVYLLRQSLGEEAIVSRGDEEIGLAEGALWCDAVAFEQALHAGEAEEALELYRGDLLEGFYIAEAPEFERWLESERERLRGRASEAAWRLAEQEEGEGSGVRAAAWAKKAVSFSPDDEGGFRRLLELLDRVGDRAGAVKEYEGLARRLKEEYETDPSPETQATIAAIREREVAVVRIPERTGEARAGEVWAVSAEPVSVTSQREHHAEPRPISLRRVLTTYALVSLAVLVTVHIFTLQLGLPDWFFRSAVVILLVCLPIIAATALVQEAATAARRAGAEAKPLSATVRRWLTWRNSILGGTLAFVLLGVAVTGYTGMRVRGIGPWGTLIGKGLLEERDRIVLADFEDHTGDSTLALTVTEAFRVDLCQSGVVRVAERDYVRRVLERMERDPDMPMTYDVAREVAIREGLKAVVAGAVNRAGSGYVLSARIVAADTGEELYSLRETAEGLDPIISAIDRLSNRLREQIGESLRVVRRSLPLRQVRTGSLEALRLYTEAHHASLRGGEEWRRVLDLNSRAVEIDTAFAAAYRGISEALDHLGFKGAVAAATRAYELRHRQLLWEQYATEGYYHGRVTSDRERKIDAYLRVLDLRPDHEEAIQSLGTTYRNMRQFARAEEMFRRRVELDSLAGPGWYQLAASQFNQGKYDEAEHTLRRWEANMPEHHAIQLHRAKFASARGDYDAAEKIIRDYLASHVLSSRSRSRGDRISWLAAFAQAQGKLAEAERIRREAMRAYEEAGMFGLYLHRAREIAWSYLRHADAPDRALDVAEAALQHHPLTELDSPASHALGFASLYATAGRPNVARELIAEYEAVDWKGALNLPKGWVAMAEGRPQDAIREFSEFLQSAGLGGYLSYLNPLGRALETAGEPDSAIAVYERYVNTPYDRKVTIDQLNLPFAYERLGNLYEQGADTAKAIYYYGKLVELWKDADPELQPRVEAARRAMEALSPDT